MQIKPSKRAKEVRLWLRTQAGFYNVIAQRTGIKRSWLGRYASQKSIDNPGVNQIDSLYDYMLRDLELKKPRRRAA